MDDVANGAGKAGKAVDKLKDNITGLRGFDKLNVIRSPKDNGDTGSTGGVGGGGIGGGGGVSGGIDPKILDAFNDVFGKYNDMFSKIKGN